MVMFMFVGRLETPEVEKVRDPGILDPRKDLYLTESIWPFPLGRELPLTKMRYGLEINHYLT